MYKGVCVCVSVCCVQCKWCVFITMQCSVERVPSSAPPHWNWRVDLQCPPVPPPPCIVVTVAPHAPESYACTITSRLNIL